MQSTASQAKRPLISPKSPSYERSRQAFLHPSASGDPELLSLLSRLGLAEQNAQQVCAQLSAALAGAPMTGLLDDLGALHDARRHALVRLVERLGGAMPDHAAERVLLPQTYAEAREVHTQAAANSALEVLQRELRAEYDTALQSESLDTEQRSALADLAPPAAPEHE